MSIFPRSGLGLALILTTLCAGVADAQSSKPYSLDDVATLVEGGVSTTNVLARLKGSCVDFHVTSSAAERLRSAGASESLIAGIRSVCYRGGNDDAPKPHRDPPRDNPRKIIPPLRVVDTVYVPQHVDPPVVVPPRIPVATPVIDWDLSSSRPIAPSNDGSCGYDYSGGEFTVTVVKAGGICTTGGTSGYWNDSLSVAATTRGLRGGRGYNFGIWFGFQTASVPYFVYQISQDAKYSLLEWLPADQRAGGNEWRTLINWQSSPSLYSAASGMRNRIVAEVRGTSVRLLANDAQVAVYTLPMRPLGHAGIGVFGYDRDVELPVVGFSKFTLTLLSGGASTNVVTPVTGGISWNLATDQPLSAGLYGNCRYEYANGGYTVSVDKPGSTCIDGPTGDRPASVRVAATGRGLRGGAGYTYGLRLGYTSDQSIGYYAFEVSEGGSFHFSRYRNNAWETLLPWTSSSAVNAASSGLPNDLAAEIRGTSILLFANGVQVGSYQAPTPPAGMAGFGIIGYDQTLANPSVVFTRFSITPLY